MTWFDYGVDAPPKWQIVAHVIFAVGAIGLGYLYWGWAGAFGGYLLERGVSKLIYWPYFGKNLEETEEEKAERVAAEAEKRIAEVKKIDM